MSINAFFRIEGGKALEMVQAHIAERIRVQKEVSVLANELGITEGRTDRMTGILTGVMFPNDIHADFTKPKKRNDSSYPKKKSAWAARFAAQKGYRDPANWIAKEFGIPLSISFRNIDNKSEDGNGWAHIGSLLTECGFLFLSEQGPYAMWTPDVPAIVASRTSPNVVVEEPAASFKLEFEGCCRIEKEEWEILVLQHELKEKLSNQKNTNSDIIENAP